MFIYFFACGGSIPAADELFEERFCFFVAGGVAVRPPPVQFLPQLHH
jgi:hypothetical protein